jgi:quinoprotein glucose dehydrogenase
VRRRSSAIIIILVFCAILWIALSRHGQSPPAIPPGEWRSYNGAQTGAKYSPLDQINPTTVRKLKIAWRWSSPDNDLIQQRRGLWPHGFEVTPVMARDVLYATTSLNQVAAIDATTGKTIWVHDPGTWKGPVPTNFGFIHRGVAYWEDGSDRRVLIATADAYLLALDARSGKPIASFGQNGRVDLTQGLRKPIDRRLYGVTSPPAIYRNVVIVGSSVLDNTSHRDQPPGDVRGFDVRTGRQIWTFQSIPQPGAFGNETWEGESWKYSGNTNVWAVMSVDETLGYVYLPFSTPTNDFYGGHRLGNNLFADTLVCLDAATGKRIWHFQFVHHGLWDYDLPAAPNLVDITVGGKQIKAVAQVSKQGFVYVLDRVTGAPVWPIEERPVPRSSIPGERTAPTQPFPTRPRPFERQGITVDDLIDFTPELRKEALAILEKYDYGPLFTPPTEKGTVAVPGWVGGASWAGAAFDPETRTLYVPSVTNPILYALRKANPKNADVRYLGRGDALVGPRGLPLLKPPYGRITAIDLNRGEHAWMIPLGSGPRDHPAIKAKDPLGWPQRGFVLVTKTLLFACWEGERVGTGRPLQHRFETVEPVLQAHDKSNGKLLWKVDLPANASGSPMTYLSRGTQFVVVAVGGAGLPGQLVALSVN